MPKSPAEMHEAIARNLQKNTGKTLEQWIEVVKKSGPKDRKEKITWLKTKHQLGSGQAGTITKMMYEGMADYDPEYLMQSHFNGDKDYQKPIYDKIAASLKKWGDHKIAVNKTYLSLIHRQQFAIIKTTKDGMVIGVPELAVKAAKNKEFKTTKNLGSDRITHKLLLNDISDLSDGVMRVLKASYDRC
ncbi:MAG TPA: DUF5655 domain-containing protein [Chitinophagales bacterium]|nr:DUF5655 domain-containing protein [Chitinophagales bacterium]